ncbi:hypothetical protein PMI30_00667 [Pseudomonas sp. GM50]|uniref:hypothetical protein n=1 Tax=Pseudomonas sp. GM50 TaxID=1144332 RepID=UPI000270AFE9|nr:hypothetical protein [Pseudomonas sp. GM50]EJM70720.1 hypothetical protein PMI30_00667 [Pseudomonas sp. GM50]
MIELYELKYSLSAFLVTSLIVFLGFLPWITSRKKTAQSSESLIERVCLSVISCAVYLAIIGCIIAIVPLQLRHSIALLFIAPLLILGAFKTTQLLKQQHFKKPSSLEVFTIGGFFVFAISILILSSIKFPLKPSLPDGAYVNKEHVTSVRIQSITGDLPPDNVIPYVAQEYIARSISFINNSPILPGQHVANRPILVSLAALPVRMALRSVKPQGDLPTFEYVDTQWPDFRILLRDQATFPIFLGVAVFLNSCLLLGVGLIATKIINLKWHNSALMLLLFVTSPYFIFQTIFTWPKSLAGFFIITSYFFYQKHRNTLIAGSLLALAYLSHPYTIGYLAVATFALLALDKSTDIYIRVARSARLCLSFAIVVSPWFIWTKLYAGGSSDLISQNFSLANITAFQFVWPRIANLANTILPIHLLPFETHLTSMYIQSSLNLAGAVGTLFLVYVASMAVFFSLVKPNPQATLYSSQAHTELKQAALIFGASSVLLACVFSYAAVPLLHGWQPFAALIVVLGVYWASFSKIALVACWTQVGINFLITGVYFYRRFLVAA